MLVTAFFIVGNSKEKEIKNNISVKKILKVEIDNERLFLKNHISMKVDENDNVYILDKKECKIYILSKEGVLKKNFRQKRGRTRGIYQHIRFYYFKIKINSF
jgi:hypothetical protein